MLRKLTYHSIIPAFLFLLLVAVPAAEATDEERNMSHPVTLQDGTPALSRAGKYDLGKVEA